MDEQQVPAWAQALVIEVPRLVREVTILNERLPNHIEWTERNVLDHEKRIRVLEQFRWMIVGIASLSGLFGIVISKVLGI